MIARHCSPNSNCILPGAKLGFPSGAVLKNLSAYAKKQEMWVQPLGWEDPLEEGMATRTSILGWEIPWTEEPSGLQSTESESQT